VKEIVEASKNIAALKEAKEGLENELAKTHSNHQEALKSVEDAANEEMESLKRTISDQAELLRARDSEMKKVRKVHEDATLAMWYELEQSIAEFDQIDVELKSKSVILERYPPCLVQAYCSDTILFFFPILQSLTPMEKALAWSSCKPSTSTWSALQPPVLR
jgi:acetoin utilization deacetylase AcuC-like enzyme